MRKTARQKQAFRDFLCRELTQQNIPCRVETFGRFIKSHNIIIGDPETSDYLVSAHYDTAPELPFPNLIFPKSILGNVLFGLGLFAAIWLLMGLIGSLVSHLMPAGRILPLTVGFMLLILIWVFKGKANPNTANDNTSGVISLLEILHRTDLETARASFILFDNEELGLLGSSAFAKKYRPLLKQKILINFDCVSDGDDIFLVQSKTALPETQARLAETIPSTGAKKVHLTSAKKTLFPSDQWNFPKSIGVFAARKVPLLGYYIGRVHTRRDVKFDQANIALLANGFSRFIRPDSE